MGTSRRVFLDCRWSFLVREDFPFQRLSFSILLYRPLSNFPFSGSGDKPQQGRLTNLFKTANLIHQLPQHHQRQRRALGRAQRAEQRQARDTLKAAYRPLLEELRMDWN